MSGVLLVELEGMEPTLAGIRNVSDIFERGAFMDGVGALIESSTKRRFDEQTGPDGQAWAPWSKAHGETRRPGQSLLVESGDLRDSNQLYTRPDEAQVGNNLVYGAIHQFGGMAGRGRKVQIPERPYLGLSDRDRDDIRNLVEEMLS